MYTGNLLLPSWWAQRRSIFNQALGSFLEVIVVALILHKAPSELSSGGTALCIQGARPYVPGLPAVQRCRLLPAHFK